MGSSDKPGGHIVPFGPDDADATEKMRLPDAGFEVPKGQAHVIIMNGERLGEHRAVHGELVIGRGKDADLRIVDSGVSRKHAKITLEPDGSYVLRDLGSRNGVGLPGKGKVEFSELRSGMRFTIGHHVLKFVMDDLLEQRFSEAQKLHSVGQLAGGIAHDFNNLLMIVSGGIEILRGELGESCSEEAASVLDDLDNVTRSGATLTGQLLGFARHSEDVESDVSVEQLLGETASIAQRTFPKTIRIRTTPATGVVSAVESDLRRVLLNMCINSRDAVGESGTILLGAEIVEVSKSDAVTKGLVAGDYVRITIEDDGNGMDEATRSRVFEPYFTTKESDKGTGLGLAMAYGVVRRHGGAIEVVSAAGEGTTFTIYLPSRELMNSVTLESAAIETRPSSPPPTTHPPTILVVDDVPEIRRVTERLLQNLGYPTIVASDGFEALELYRENQDLIGLVLLDLAMPKISGVDTLHALRKVDPEVRALFCSGYGEAQEAEAKRHGVGFLRKPYRLKQLSQSINSALAMS